MAKSVHGRSRNAFKLELHHWSRVFKTQDASFYFPFQHMLTYHIFSLHCANLQNPSKKSSQILGHRYCTLSECNAGPWSLLKEDPLGWEDGPVFMFLSLRIWALCPNSISEPTGIGLPCGPRPWTSRPGEWRTLLPRTVGLGQLLYLTKDIAVRSFFFFFFFNVSVYVFEASF